MAIRLMRTCRKCGRQFDWNNDEGYAKLSDGTYLCSISCDLKEVNDRLALALNAVEAAKGIVAQTFWENGDAGDWYCECCHRVITENGKLVHKGNCAVKEFLELVTKLEQSK